MDRRGISIALALGLVLALAWPRSALANMARSSWPGDRHGPLLASGPTTVRVDAEDLSFKLAPELNSAHVTARYRMTNTGAAPTHGEVAFVFVQGDYDRFDGTLPSTPPSITIDGAPSGFRIIEGAELPEKGPGPWSDISSEHLGWLVFDLGFAAGQTRTVEVGYIHCPSRDDGERVNPVFTYDYLLSPAKSWASFGPLHLRVQLPAGAELLSTTVPLVRDGNGYRADLAGLPDGELTFELMPTGGLWFGMSNSSSYFGLLFAVVLALVLGVCWPLGRAWRRASPLRSSISMVLGICVLVMLLVSVALSLLGQLMPRHALGFGYGEGFSFMGLWLLALVLSVATSALAVRGRLVPEPVEPVVEPA